MKFGAIAVVIGVIIVILGFAVPTMSIVPTVSAPVLQTAYGMPNPTIVGETVTFLANVNWNGQVGTITWLAYGYAVTGNQFVFKHAGQYYITATATNSVGSSTNGFVEYVNSGSTITPPTIISASASPNPAIVGQTVVFSDNVSWNGHTGPVTWEVNGQLLSGNTYVFTSPGTYNITIEASNAGGAVDKSFNEVVNSGSVAPIIEVITGSPNPAVVNQTVTFSDNVNWNGPVGTTTWILNGYISNGVQYGTPISGNTYVFHSVGEYNITLEAKNSVGMVDKGFYEYVQTAAPHPNYTTPELRNIGTFYVVSNGKSYNLQTTTSLTTTSMKYPTNLSIYYVENHGITQNLSGITVTVNSNNYTLSLQNKTTYEGNNAYAMTIKNMQSGNYTVTGFFHVYLVGSTIQAFSTVISLPSTPTVTHVPPPPVALTPHIDMIVIIIGILVMIGGAVMVKFGI